MRVIYNFDMSDISQLEVMSNEHRLEIGLDTESVDLSKDAVTLGVAIALDAERGMYFFDPADSIAKDFVANSDNVWLQNASFDVPKLETKYGYRFSHWDDTMILAYSAGILEKNLQSLSLDFLHKSCPSVTELWKKPNQGNIGIDNSKLGGMSIIHACNTLALSHSIPRTPLYDNIDRPVLDLVIEMQKWGVLIDQVQLTKMEQSVMVQVIQLEQEIYTGLDMVINLASNPQVAAALQLKGILGTRKTKSGAESVSDESLKPLNNPLADKILKHRSLMKNISTYVPAFRKMIDHVGRLHTSFGLARTGRWTSSDPNLQNLTTDKMYLVEE